MGAAAAKSTSIAATGHAYPAALTAEIFTIPLAPDRYLVYAPLRKAAFVANAHAVNVLAALQSGSVAPGHERDAAFIGLLERLGIVNGGPEGAPITVFDDDPAPTSVTLFLTTACNLRCTYCYAAAGDTPTKTMPIEVARRGIDFIASNAVRKGLDTIEVAFHGGGEPSVNWQTMTRSLAYAHERAEALGLHVIAAAATNGVLSDRQIDWMLANLQSASLSIDGSPSVNDRHRVTVSGKGSSPRIMHTLRRFDAAGFAYGVRVTVTRDQIVTLADSIDFICRTCNPQSIQVEPAYQLGRWRDAPSAETEEFLAAYREACARAQNHGRAIHYSGARLELLTNHFCGISQDSFCLSPDGNVSACYEAFSEDNAFAGVFFYGTPDATGSGYRFDANRIAHLRGQAVQHRPYCDGCFAKWHCAGDCYHKSLAVNGPGEFAGSERCHITRELTKDQILEQIAVSGGLCWHDCADAVTNEAPTKVSP